MEFEKRIYRVTDGVHVAVGFRLANSILIEGEDAVIIVDVLGSVGNANGIASLNYSLNGGSPAALSPKFACNSAPGSRRFLPKAKTTR